MPLYLVRESTSVRIVLQRVSAASVAVNGVAVARIGRGLCLLVGIAPDDSEADVLLAAGKIAGLRVFDDESGKMNLSITDVGGAVLVVSQFTLYADVRKGRRPSLSGAASPDHAQRLIEALVTAFQERGLRTAQGLFGESMEVSMVNEGPVTFVMNVSAGSVE